jgi:hypothetical protein
MDARLFKLGDHSGAKNKGKGIVGKHIQTVNSSTPVSKCSGQIRTTKHCKFVNTRDNTPESTICGLSGDSGNPSGSNGELFSNNLECQDMMSPIPQQQTPVKNRLLKTPS